MDMHTFQGDDTVGLASPKHLKEQVVIRSWLMMLITLKIFYFELDVSAGTSSFNRFIPLYAVALKHLRYLLYLLLIFLVLMVWVFC